MALDFANLLSMYVRTCISKSHELRIRIRAHTSLYGTVLCVVLVTIRC